MTRIPELLAPAGSPQALRAAVAAGADAVYISGKRFGARKFAANFEPPQMREAIDFAHLMGVKVYVTVNTLIREDELRDVAEYLMSLYEMGADAVLVQDLGVALAARLLVPELELHASTQATIHSREGAAWAARMGFKRVVLAREVSLSEIKEIARETAGMGLEVFVHGALCYSYSGQCLLSSAIGGRSGNRGMCAQPCRKAYVLLKGERDEYGRPRGLEAVPLREKFLLSTRDLSVYRHLEMVARSPVQSLKIEGRMKSPEYVATVTSIYRKALDGIARGGWSPSAEDELELALAFNRGFSEGHLLEAKDVMGRQMSDNQGVLIGSVASFDAKSGEASIRLCGPVAPEQGDGLVFLSPGQEVGMVVQRPARKEGLLRLKTPERVRPGARVFLTGSRALERKAKKVIGSDRIRIPVDIELSWEECALKGRIRHESGASFCLAAGNMMQKAKNQPLTARQIEEQIRRTGATPFAVRRLEMDYPGGLFAPTSALNQFRRDLLEGIKQEILRSFRPSPEDVARAREGLAQLDLDGGQVQTDGRALALAVYADSIETVRGAALSGCQRIYFEPYAKEWENRAGRIAQLLEEARDICRDVELIWKWPRITRRDFLDLSRAVLARTGVCSVMVESPGAALAVLDAAPGARLLGASGLNVWNHLTVRSLCPPFQLLTLSPELSGSQMARTVTWAHQNMGSLEMELVVQGSLEVMVTEDCIPCLESGKGKAPPPAFWGLQDFKRVFPLRLDSDGRTHIFNSAETCLLDFLPQIHEIGIDAVAVDARGRTQEYAQEMARLYKRAIELTLAKERSLPPELAALKEKIRPMTIGGITSGHFIKGLKEELS